MTGKCLVIMLSLVPLTGVVPLPTGLSGGDPPSSNYNSGYSSMYRGEEPQLPIYFRVTPLKYLGAHLVTLA